MNQMSGLTIHDLPPLGRSVLQRLSEALANSGDERLEGLAL